MSIRNSDLPVLRNISRENSQIFSHFFPKIAPCPTGEQPRALLSVAHIVTMKSTPAIQGKCTRFNYACSPQNRSGIGNVCDGISSYWGENKRCSCCAPSLFVMARTSSPGWKVVLPVGKQTSPFRIMAAITQELGNARSLMAILMPLAF